ncbi:MAG: asparagine synthase (glutamine-hydrolyzing), partial [Desulfovibrionales bacterium]
NHTEIRAQLKQSVFRGHSDTETILYALSELGINAVKTFNGIFGFCLFDHIEGKLFLARDPFGVKPVYYFISEKKLCFSSEIRPVNALINDNVSYDHLATLLRLRYLPAPLTIYKNIKKLRPGHLIEINLGKERISYRELPYIEDYHEQSSLSYSRALEEYDERFSAAISRQLMADVEIGVMLSGGVDSALVAARAQAFSNKPLKAFTVGFAEQALEDEIADAAETAELLGMDHHVVRISDDDFFSTLEECVRIVEEPLATTSLIPMYFLSKLSASHVKVVLTGQGADEPLGGYRRYQSQLLSPYIPNFLARIADKCFKLSGVKSQALLRGASSLGEPDDVLRFLLAYEVFSRSEIKRLIGTEETGAVEACRYVYDFLQCDKTSNPAERMMMLDSRMNLADDLLLYTDKITMWHSLECRVPVLDLDLVRFIESLPLAYKTKLLKRKIIHKNYAQNLLPAHIVNRRKKAFQSPTKKWFGNGSMLRERLLDSTSQFSTFFDLKEVESVIAQHQSGYNKERNIFLLLAVKAVLEVS